MKKANKPYFHKAKKPMDQRGVIWEKKNPVFSCRRVVSLFVAASFMVGLSFFIPLWIGMIFGLMFGYLSQICPLWDDL